MKIHIPNADPGPPPAGKIYKPNPPTPDPGPPPAGKIYNPNPLVLLTVVVDCCCRRHTGKPALPAKKHTSTHPHTNPLSQNGYGQMAKSARVAVVAVVVVVVVATRESRLCRQKPQNASLNQ